MIPIWFIVTILLSFTWLFYESDWMRIRLPVGAVKKTATFEDWCSMFMRYPADFKVHWDGNGEISIDDAPQFVELHKDDFNLLSGIESPICGWEWIESRQHPIPQYKIEIIAWGVHHKIRLYDANRMKQVCQVTLRPNKEERKQITQQNKALRLASKV